MPTSSIQRATASAYEAGGAAAISVLTEPHYFQGSLDYLGVVRGVVGPDMPLLRKDFIVDPYQLYEAAAYGADAVLLIAAVLKPENLRQMLGLSGDLGLDCLVEIHNEAELAQVLDCSAGIIGINNRNLHDFSVDITTTRNLLSQIPKGLVTVSESGIKTRADIERIRGWGADAILIGEALTSAPDILGKMREL
ncbi:indole-3-glycerol-phosphate synthase, partial [Chloroflexota bacterium]